MTQLAQSDRDRRRVRSWTASLMAVSEENVPIALLDALWLFLREAVAFRSSLPDALPAVKAFARSLAALPSAVAAGQVAMETAAANAYVIREGTPADHRRAGRALSADNLVDTGVAGLLLSADLIDQPVLTTELAAYLAGPPISLLNYAITDGNVEIRAPVEVVDGWELVTPTREDLARLTGIPSAATYAPRRSLHHDLYGGLAMLRRIDPTGNPRSGFVIYFTHPSWDLWKPLLALSLYRIRYCISGLSMRSSPGGV